jgi:hypothetical protein
MNGVKTEKLNFNIKKSRVVLRKKVNSSEEPRKLRDRSPIRFNKKYNLQNLNYK